MDNSALKAHLGFAVKAGKLVSGTQGVEQALRAGKVKLVLLSSGASENTLKHFSDMASWRRVPCMRLEDHDELGLWIGRETHRIAGITDNGFAEAVKKDLGVKE